MDIREVLFFIVSLLMISMCVPVNAKEFESNLVEVQRIWDKAPHCAFTDLTRFKDQWFCTFRESDKHVRGRDGDIRVIVSPDGHDWQSAALLTEDGVDLRDPKLSITPEGRLMLVIGGSVYEGEKLTSRQPRVTLSDDGKTWTPLQPIMSKGDWLWRVTWHKGKAYGVSYKGGCSLYVSEDGINYNLVTKWDIDGHPNETTVRFLPNDEMIAMVRRDGEDKMAWIGKSKPPYINWNWSPTTHRIGGPDFIVLPNGEMWVSGRSYGEGGSKTMVARMGLGDYEPVLTLPSGGDTSYPGMVWYDNKLWISYYSSHEEGTAIYLAEMLIDQDAKGDKHE